MVRIFGWKSVPGQDAYKRFFSKFSQAINQKVFGYFYDWFFSQLRFDNYTLDFDSSVLTRYGKQQGARKGYNPRKPGRASHHPLLAFVADCNMVANLWLRSGDSHTTNNFKGFLEDTLTHPGNKTPSLLRLDSGFYDKALLEYLEKRHLNYIVALPFYEPIQHILASCSCWFALSQGVEVAQTYYQSPQWDQSRRMIMTRQQVELRPQATGKQLKLFREEGIYKQYRYTCFITNLKFSPAEVWRLYRHRAEAEKRIKELKYDFGFASFNMHQFLPPRQLAILSCLPVI